jgi:hypothetical protein
VYSPLRVWVQFRKGSTDLLLDEIIMRREVPDRNLAINEPLNARESLLAVEYGHGLIGIDEEVKRGNGPPSQECVNEFGLLLGVPCDAALEVRLQVNLGFVDPGDGGPDVRLPRIKSHASSPIRIGQTKLTLPARQRSRRQHAESWWLVFRIGPG